MARKQGSGFKMKSSPAKQGILSDFFGSLGKQLKRNKKGVDEMYAEKKSRKPGESKYQADIRRGKEERKKEKKIERESIKLADEKWGKEGIVIKGSDTPEITPEWITDKAKSSWRYKKNPDGSFTTKDTDRPEMKEIIVEEGDELFDTISGVFKKKSPYKKGLGKYTKKAKGSRGYKMKK